MTQAPGALLLTDGVVLLDRFTDADIDALWAGEDDGYVRRSRLPGPLTRRDIANQIRQWQDQWRVGGTGRALAVRETGSRRLVGGCVLEVRPGDGEIAELSYWVFPPYRGRGYATRSAELVCRYAFDDLGVVRMELYIDRTNTASLRVATKAGFRQEDLLGQHERHQGGRTDMVLVARLSHGQPGVGIRRAVRSRLEAHAPNRRWTRSAAIRRLGRAANPLEKAGQPRGEALTAVETFLSSK